MGLLNEQKAGGNAENTATANSRALQSSAVQGVLPGCHRMSQKQSLFLVHLLILFFPSYFLVWKQ